MKTLIRTSKPIQDIVTLLIRKRSVFDRETGFVSCAKITTILSGKFAIDVKFSLGTKMDIWFWGRSVYPVRVWKDLGRSSKVSRLRFGIPKRLVKMVRGSFRMWPERPRVMGAKPTWRKGLRMITWWTWVVWILTKMILRIRMRIVIITGSTMRATSRSVFLIYRELSILSSLIN